MQLFILVKLKKQSFLSDTYLSDTYIEKHRLELVACNEADAFSICSHHVNDNSAWILYDRNWNILASKIPGENWEQSRGEKYAQVK